MYFDLVLLYIIFLKLKGKQKLKQLQKRGIANL